MIIGTHNSGAYKIDFGRCYPKKYWFLKPSCFRDRVRAFTITQSDDIRRQILGGVRAVDLRISHGDGVFYVSHTFFCETLDNIMYQIAMTNPTKDDPVYVFVKPDWDNAASLVGLNVVEYLLHWASDGVRIYYEGKALTGLPEEIEAIWLNVSDVDGFERSYRELSPERLRNAALFGVLTPPGNPSVRDLLRFDLKRDYADKLWPRLLRLLEEKRPRFLLIDFYTRDAAEKIDFISHENQAP